MNLPITVTVLGCRGSMAVSGTPFARYGGATTSVLIRTEKQALILDAGTGLLNLVSAQWEGTNVRLFLTHPHADHLIGLPLCAPMLKKGQRLELYGAVRNGLNVRAQVCALLSPPLWPVGPELLPAQVSFHTLEPRMQLEDVLVESMEGVHPGGVSVLRLTVGGVRIVLLTDCTITADRREALLDFCRDCDLLLCDGQYSPEEWAVCSGFGHNTWIQAAAFGRDCGAKQIRIIHHDPTHTDALLDRAQEEVQTICPRCTLAYEGERLTL